MNSSESQTPQAEPAVTASTRPGRRRVRAGVVAGIAALTLAGGGLTAVAFASSPTPGAAVDAAAPTTTTTAPTDGSTAPTDGATPPADGTTRVPKVRTPHLDGTVTSVSGSKILIKDRDGFTRTILVSSSTTYTDDLSADIAVGTAIRAEGAVDADGTSLDATTVGADKGPGAGGPGGFGGRGPGGPGGHGGFGGPRPDGAGPKDGTAPDGSTPGGSTDGSSPAPTTEPAPSTS